MKTFNSVILNGRFKMVDDSRSFFDNNWRHHDITAIVKDYLCYRLLLDFARLLTLSCVILWPYHKRFWSYRVVASEVSPRSQEATWSKDICFYLKTDKLYVFSSKHLCFSVTENVNFSKRSPEQNQFMYSDWAKQCQW